MVLDSYNCSIEDTENMQRVIEKAYRTTPQSIIDELLKISYNMCRADEYIKGPSLALPAMRKLS